MLSDDDSQKFTMKGQTEMKHRILKAYMNPWLKKISRVDDTILFVDGFAGPGRYTDDSEGSPLIVMDMANELLKSLSHVNEFRCVFIEIEPTNHSQLVEEVQAKKPEIDERIQPVCRRDGFESWANEFITEHQTESPPPGLIFIDPFGYSGIPFETISELYNLRNGAWELLITFMAGKMAQWMGDENHQKAITETLGTSSWLNEIEDTLPKNDRAERFSSIYQRQLQTKARAKFTMPFEMMEESKKQICYYLIHVTDRYDGLEVMKETMFNTGAEDQFAYLGPDHSGFEDSQSSFTEFGVTDDFEKRKEEFAWELYERYKGEEITFENILRETFDKNVFKKTHYRDAFDYLKSQGRLSVTHRPTFPNGNESRGYGRDDLIEFIPQESIFSFT